MQPLITLSLEGYRAILPPGQDHAGAHRALTALLSETLGAEVTGFFAPVSATEQGMSFFAPEGRVARFADLAATGRERLRAEIGRIISALRRGAAPAALAEPARASTPSDSRLHVDQRHEDVPRLRVLEQEVAEGRGRASGASRDFERGGATAAPRAAPDTARTRSRSPPTAPPRRGSSSA